jgi:hypothetical protein
MERNPLPDPASWRAIDDPYERVRVGLAELFAFYARNEGMLANVIRDADADPVLAEIAALRMAAMADLRDALADGLTPDRASTQLAPALDLAMDFNTWRLLVRRTGLTEQDAVELLVAMLRSLN